MKSDSIPIELILEILSRLPAKSIARFHSVSKLWSSILRRPHFKQLFLTRSPSAQPRLLFAIEKHGVWSFFSLPQRQTPHENSPSPSPSIAAAEFHTKFPPEKMQIYPRSDRRFTCGYASGLIYFYGMWINEDDYDGVPVICNPKTGRYTALPDLQRYRKAYSFFGFDPIQKQYKVLFMKYPSGPDDHKIITLGNGEMKWRDIDCSVTHENLNEGICINGVCYYLGDLSRCSDDLVIVCFNIRTEEFEFIYPEGFCQLINYRGKLGLVYYDDYKDDAIEFRVWVLEDFKKQEWSKYEYTLKDEIFSDHYVSVVGVVDATGEIVLSMGDYTVDEPFYVFYFDPERNTMQRVEIGGFGEYFNDVCKKHRVHVFVDDCSSFYEFADRAVDLDVNETKLLKSSIYTANVKEAEEELE